MKYLKKFANHSEYLVFTNNGNFLRPNTSACADDNHVHFNSNNYLTFVAKTDGTFKFSGNSINYSVDNGQTWVSLASNTDTPTVSAGSRIMWKASGLTPTNYKGIGRFSSTGQFDVVGNIMSLVSGDSFTEAITVADYQFQNLFSRCTGLASADNLVLPSTTMAESAYTAMFSGCTSLTAAPQLPATTLGTSCYSYMFNGCKSLTTTPELPATTLASGCYTYMFSGCTSLTTAPELPATTLADNCYQRMFSNCTSLTTAPELPATTLGWSCYQSMFEGCTSLVTAPELPSTTLTPSCYSYMFKDCTSLTAAPELPATTLGTSCYSYMFSGCSSLNYIKAMFTTTPSTTYTYSWVNGVASNGTFVKNSAATWNVTGVSGIPTGWTVQTASA